MKNLFVLTIILILSCKNKDASIPTSKIVQVIENSSSSSNPETISNNSYFTRTHLYKGTLNGTINIRLYLHEQEHPCGGDLTLLSTIFRSF